MKIFGNRLAIVLCVLVLTSSAVAGESRPSGKVVVIGIDGMTFNVIQPLVKAGKLPTIGGMLSRGAHAVLVSEKPMRSPALWTTVATGQPRDKHGIYDFVTGSAYWPKNRRGGVQRLVRSSMRRSPALWQLAGSSGRESLVVGWLNTWPAEPITGAMVAPFVALGAEKQTSIKGKIYSDERHQSWPPELFDQLTEHIVDADEVSETELRQLADLPKNGSRLYRQIKRLKRYSYTLRWSLASARTNVAIVRELLSKRPDVDLVMTYFDGTDTLSHRFWHLRESIPRIRRRLRAHGLNPRLAPELKRRYGDVVDNTYILVDRMVAEIRAAAGDDANIILISDHGWGSQNTAKALHDHVPFDGRHLLEGVFIAEGPDIAPGALEPLTLYDIAPTTLYMLGVPVPAEMPGEVVTALLGDDFKSTNGFGKLARKTPNSSPAKSEIGTGGAANNDSGYFENRELERLRSLGYVQ